MKTNTFGKNCFAAFGLAVLSTMLYTLSKGILSTYLALKLLISITILAYLIYLLLINNKRKGLFFFPVITVTLGGLLYYTDVPISVYLLAHTLTLWLTRLFSFSYRASQSLLDLIISLASIVAGYWAMLQTGSWFVAFWSYFLVHALITPDIFSLFFSFDNHDRQTVCGPTNKFSRAHRNAENAIKRVLSHNR